MSRRVKPKLAPAFGKEEKLYLAKAILLIAAIYIFRNFIYAYWPSTSEAVTNCKISRIMPI